MVKMKQVLKSIACGISTVFVLPLYVSYLLNRCLSNANAALESHSQFISLVPGKIGNYLRNAFYRLTLDHCDPEATICFGVLISSTKARIGRHAYIASHSCLGWVTIEEDVLLAPSVHVLGGPHMHTFDSLNIPIRNQPRKPHCVTIGRDSWIGTGTVVLADVSSQVVVGANSTVTKPIPARAIAVGSPAKILNFRDEDPS